MNKQDKSWSWIKIIQIAFITFLLGAGIMFGGKCNETFNNNPVALPVDPEPIISPESIEAKRNTDRTLEELQQLISEFETEIRRTETTDR